MKKLTLMLAQAVCLLFFAPSLFAGPGVITKFIKIDQFGYFPNARKVAVIADPQAGFNAAEAFSPGTGANQYQVRRFSDDAIVFSGTITSWKSGTTHAQSGDRGWWFDFSSFTTPGSYYIFDVANNVGSYQFDIGTNVYDNALKAAVRMYYYQRLSFAKQPPYTDSKWSDAAAYDGPNQDRAARSRYAKNDASTARDLHGGWMDAGDVNKYTTFAESAVIQLVEAYRINPNAFGDNYSIPESGNGIPDIIDELMYELDFLKRMQDGTGTNGFLLKIGVDNYNEVSPISSDTRPKYYVPECTSATLSGAAMFAVAGSAFKQHANTTVVNYGNDLIARAEAAWARAKVTTGNFTSYQTNCDDGDIKSGDADKDAQSQLESAFITAVYLYEATGKSEYKTFAEARYTQVQPYSINWWGPYWAQQQLALLRLANIPGVSSTVANNIRNQKAGMSYLNSITDYNNATDLYRAFMADAQYHWGSNQPKTNSGLANLDFATFNINTANAALYKEIAEQYLHYMHGVNPLSMVMLSNMYGLGAENCVNEIYHTWFNDGTVWDNALTSSKGPAPGYVTGGPNKSYSGTVANISNQPAQKAYKDWNAGYPENSWEITEPAIYSNASYVMLLARLVSGIPTPPDTEAPTAPVLSFSNVGTGSLTLNWTAATDNVGVTGYEVYQGSTLLNGNVPWLTFNVTGLTCNTAYTFTVKAKDAAGNKSVASNVVNPTTAACPDTEAPSAPVLSYNNVTQTTLTLNWTASTDNVGVTGYEVYQGPTLLNGNVTSLTYNVSNLTCNTAYNFTVKAKDAAGNKSASSNAVNPVTAACPVDNEAPTAPVLSYGNVGQTSLTLNWTAATDNVGVTGYEVYQGTTLLNNNVTSLTYQVTNLTCATGYSFTVKAKDAAGNTSNASNAVHPTTAGCPPSASDIVIYDEVLQAGWDDALSESVSLNYSNTNPVQTGSKSLKVDYGRKSDMTLRRNSAVTTTTQTVLRFWVYTTVKGNGIQVYTRPTENGAISAYYSANIGTNQWQEIVLDLNQLGNPTDIKTITIKSSSNKTSTIYFDNIRLMNVVSFARQVAGNSLKSLSTEEEIFVFPNPAHDQVFVKYQSAKAGKVMLKMMNAAGAITLERTENVVTGVNQFVINSGSLSNGTYYVQVMGREGMKMKQVMIRH